MKAERAQAAGKGTGMNAYPLGRWTLNANPFKSSAKPARRPVVQGELSLEKVKVVRNDLSDSDLELVVATGQAKPPAGGNAFSATSSTATKKLSVWGIIRARLFRAKGQ